MMNREVKHIPLVSIIVPIFNVEQYINKCIESIVSQSYTNLQILLVDDGSTDKSLDIIEPYLSDKRIQLICKKNTGQSDSRNLAYKYATGEYLFFSDSDDYLEHDTIKELVDCIESTESDFCCCRYRLVDINGAVLKECPIYTVSSISGNESVIENTFGLNANIKMTLWTKLIRRSFMVEHNIFPRTEITLHDDCMLTYLCAVHAKAVSFTNRILYNVVQRPTSISRACKPLMVTVYEDIFTILKNEMVQVGNFSKYEKLYYASYAKSVLYALVLACNRSQRYNQFKKIHSAIGQSSIYYNSTFKEIIRTRYVKLYLLYRISNCPKLFYALSKTVLKFDH